MYLDLTWTIKKLVVTSLSYLQFMDLCNCQLVLVQLKEMDLHESTQLWQITFFCAGHHEQQVEWKSVPRDIYFIKCCELQNIIDLISAHFWKC
jgi:hypothetical protein